MSFKEIRCQDRAISLLQRAYGSDHTAHAYIFSGAEGIGKYKTASALAKLLLCLSPLTEHRDGGAFSESCGQCESCRLWDGDAHPDFNHVYKELRQFTADGKGKAAPVELPIDVIREFLIARVATRPTISSRKVFVVSESEKLNTASQNALLKVLEEPPAYCCLLLLCTRLDKLLPTIKSRAQVIRFGPIDESIVVDYLVHKGLDTDRSVYFSRLSRGSLGSAGRWADLELAGAELYVHKQEIIASLAALTLGDTVVFAEGLLAKAKQLLECWVKLEKDVSRTDLNRRTQKTMVHIVLSLLEDAMKMDMALPREAINEDQPGCIRSFSQRFSPDAMTDRVVDCYEALQWIESGVNERLIFERLLLRIIDSGIIPGL
jgi:DNA polymerase III subunit delta'